MRSKSLKPASTRSRNEPVVSSMRSLISRARSLHHRRLRGRAFLGLGELGIGLAEAAEVLGGRDEALIVFGGPGGFDGLGAVLEVLGEQGRGGAVLVVDAHRLLERSIALGRSPSAANFLAASTCSFTVPVGLGGPGGINESVEFEPRTSRIGGAGAGRRRGIRNIRNPQA